MQHPRALEIGHERPLAEDEDAPIEFQLEPLLEWESDVPLGFSGPSGVLPTEAQESSHFAPVEDRWRINARTAIRLGLRGLRLGLRLQLRRERLGLGGLRLGLGGLRLCRGLGRRDPLLRLRDLDGDIVVVNTSAGARYGHDDYLVSGCGMGREATLYLLERGVRVTGTDAWSWDAPFAHTVAVVTPDVHGCADRESQEAASVFVSHGVETWIVCHTPKN